MSSTEPDKNIKKESESKEENVLNINEQNNLILDLYDDDTLNISLEEEKPLFTKLYSSIVEKISSVKPESEQSNDFLVEFENLFKNQIEVINSCVKNNESNFIYATNVLVAKVKIFNFFGTKYLEEFLGKSDEESSKVLKLISENLTQSVNKMVEIIKKLALKGNEINNTLLNLQGKLGQNELYIKQLNDKNKIMNEKYIKLKEENELITQKLINNSYFNSMNTNNNILENANPDINNNNNNSQNSKLINPQQLLSLEKKIESNISDSQFSKNPINNNVILTNLSLAGNRVFTLKMMKEIISNIYISKNNFDKKCIQCKQPKQTMEEYMYTYLNQKYGLKNMVIEWATNIINGIRTFSKEDTEISLFGKILQNELEENCKLLIDNIKQNVNTIIMNILRVENPFKNEDELNTIKNNYIKTVIPPEKIQQIIETLFDEKGRMILFNKINAQIENKKNIMMMKENTAKGRLTREEMNKIINSKEREYNSIQYDYLIDICLEYQIKLHIKYLKPFIKLFQSIDTDRDGVLDEEQFVLLIKNMNLFNESNIVQVIEQFLNILDPYGYKRIIFTDIVDLFSKNNYDNEQTIMDKFCCEKDAESKKNSKNNSYKKEKNSSGKKKIRKLNEDVIVK